MAARGMAVNGIASLSIAALVVAALVLAAAVVAALGMAGPSAARPSTVAAGVAKQSRLARGVTLTPPAVTMSAALHPERLGEPTTFTVSFALHVGRGSVPPPLRTMALLLPAGMSIASTELGLSTCPVTTLLADPLARCPQNSEIGLGSARAEVPFGTEVVPEKVSIALFSGPLSAGSPTITAEASGEHPVIANIVFSGIIDSAESPYGAALKLTLPPVEGLPEGPDVSVQSMTTTIGPRGITYEEVVKGKVVRFKPSGVVLPPRCPRGGFPFAVRLSFADGAQASARTVVRCPHRRAARKATRQRRARRD